MSNQSNNVIEHKSAAIVACLFFPLLYFFHDFGVEVVPVSTIVALMFAIPLVIKDAYSNIQTEFFVHERTVTIPFLLILLLINLSFYFMELSNNTHTLISSVDDLVF